MDEAPLRSIGNLADSAPLWRYVRLSSLLNLLNGNVFVPTIKTLQEKDPKEAATYCKATHTCFKRYPPVKNGSSSVCHKARARFLRAKPWRGSLAIFASIWLRELANRRCVWCCSTMEISNQWRSGTSMRVWCRD